MLAQHQRWLDDFLGHLENRNRSHHTLFNYQHDLKIFIQWFEKGYPEQLLNLAHVQVISEYSNFLSEGFSRNFPALPNSDDRQLLMRVRPKAKSGPWWRKLFGHLSQWWQFKSRTRPVASTIVDIPKRRFLPESTKFSRSPLSANSRRRHLSTIKNFFEYHKQLNEDYNRLFPANPVKSKIHGIKVKDQDVAHTVFLPPADWDKLDEAIYRPRDRLILYLLYYAGLRLSEVANLKRENFRPHGQVLSVMRKGGIRHEYVPEKAKEIFDLLELHLHHNSPTGTYVFPTKKGLPTPARVLSRQIVMMVKRAKCETRGISPHSFRKACATSMYQKKKDLLWVRDYLHHSDAKVTQTYIDPSAFHLT